MEKLEDWLSSIYQGKTLPKEEEIILTEENKKKVEDYRKHLESTLEDGGYSIGADDLPSERKVVMWTGKGGKINYECMLLEELLKEQQRFLGE